MKSGIFPSSSHRLGYRVIGQGPPLLLLHGWAMEGAVWQEQIEALSSHYCLYLPDWPGHGLSRKMEEPFTLERLADDLHSFIEEKKLAKPVLMGWSLGAMAALVCSVNHEEKIGGLILTGCTPSFTATAGFPHGQPLVTTRRLKKKLEKDFEGELRQFVTGFFFEFEELYVKEEIKERARRLLLGASFPPDSQAVVGLLDSLARWELPLGADQLDIPVLIIHGEIDRIMPSAAAEALAATMKKSELSLYEGAGHAPFLSDPGRFNREVVGFLSSLENSRLWRGKS